VAENRRVADGRVVQRQVLYLGEINDAQRAAWCRCIEVFDDVRAAAAQIALFPEERAVPQLECEVVQVRLNELQLRHPRQWGACWLACTLWDLLGLDTFWWPRLKPSRKGTRWLNVLKVLTAYRLIDPGSAWGLHRQWYDRSAMGALLGEDFASAQSEGESIHGHSTHGRDRNTKRVVAEREQHVAPGDGHTEADQGEHIGAAVADRLTAAHQQRPAAPEHDRRGH